MLLVMGVALYTSRVVLDVLGITDYGIYSVVGGFVAMMGFFSSSLSNASLRYISIGLGKNDQIETKQAFKQSFTIMLILSFLLLIIGETIGLWFVCNKLVIPPHRLDTAIWVYQASLISVITTINQVSLMATIIAHEKMNIYAYLGIFEAVSKLVIAYIITWMSNMDSLILYSYLTTFISIAIFITYLTYCIRNFPECQSISLYWNKKMAKEMSHFIGYNLFGCFAWSAGIEGTNIILNLFFGPIINAARAISVQVSAVTTRFTENIITAFKPQIIKSYASNEQTYMFSLIERSSKFSYFMAAIISIPIMFDIEYILELWLGQTPEYTISFCRLALCDSLIGVFVPPLWIAVNATGKIKNNQVYGRLITLAVLPASYLLLKVYSNPVIPFIITLVSSILYWMYCIYDIKKQIGFDISSYINHVIRPSLLFSLALVTVGSIILLIKDISSFPRLIVLIITSVVIGCFAAYFLLDKAERSFIKETINKQRKK